VIHSHSFSSGAAWRGKRALVLGTGNSGHDVAQDLHSHDVATTIIQRGSTTVVSIDPSAKMNYALYDEGPSLEDCDLIATSGTLSADHSRLSIGRAAHGGIGQGFDRGAEGARLQI
jgi:glutamyl-tRNA reductase